MVRTSFLALGAALGLHLLITVAWYGSSPHLQPLSAFLPWVGLFLCGFVLGFIDPRATIGHAAALGILMPIVTSLVHLAAAKIGTVQDARTPEVAFVLSAILMPISVALSCAGNFLGRRQRKR
jgi:FtsH-binding integral membrane protein